MARKNKQDIQEIGTSKELYNFLFEACNIIREPISQDSFKEYITPLLYFKRLSDVKVFGQELNAGTSAIARMNCYLHGIHDFSIVNADTLEVNKYLQPLPLRPNRLSLN